MLKRISYFLLACLVITMVCIGCSKEKGFIMRDDVTYKDLEFFYGSDWEGNLDITIDDMFCVMGLPNSSMRIGDSNKSIQRYAYYFDDELFEASAIIFIFDKNGEVIDVTINPYPIDPDVELYESKPVLINRDKYKMVLREDIEEDELEEIDMEFTSADVQKLLGAPHGRVAYGNSGLRTDAYTYPLKTGNTFIISYQRNGVIVKAWVADENKKTLKVYVDRTDEMGVWGELFGEDTDIIEYH